MSEEVATQEPVAAVEPAQESTILSGGAPEPAAVPQTWQDNWRQDMAGDDAKALKQLERYNSPVDVWKKAQNLEAKLSQTRPRLEFSEDLSEKQMEEYRKQEGIPATPKDYNLEFESGLVVGEQDKPFIDGFLEYAHKNNTPEGHVKNTIEWYLDNQEKQLAEQSEKDVELRATTSANLRAEWGPEFKGNVAAIDELFVDSPEVKNILMEARLSDGSLSGDNEALVKWASGLAKKLNPAATVTLPTGDSGVQALKTRLSEIREVLRTDKARYDKDLNMQREFDALLEKESLVNSR